jgi:hypothetical protein
LAPQERIKLLARVRIPPVGLRSGRAGDDQVTFVIEPLEGNNGRTDPP